jgi:hypothetical protein
MKGRNKFLFSGRKGVNMIPKNITLESETRCRDIHIYPMVCSKCFCGNEYVHNSQGILVCNGTIGREQVIPRAKLLNKEMLRTGKNHNML